jgi:hypothetical protein
MLSDRKQKMKLSIAQTVFGILIVFGAVYVTGWMIHEASTEYEQVIPNFPVDVTNVNIIQNNETLFDIARYGSLALPVLGVLILVIGTIQSNKLYAHTWQLITLNITAGALITALAFIIFGYGKQTFSVTAIIKSTDTLISMNTLSEGFSLSMVLTIGVMLLLGLAVVGVGIAQLVKTKKVANNT